MKTYPPTPFNVRIINTPYPLGCPNGTLGQCVFVGQLFRQTREGVPDIFLIFDDKMPYETWAFYEGEFEVVP